MVYWYGETADQKLWILWTLYMKELHDLFFNKDILKIKLATNLLHFQKTPSPYLRVMFFKTVLVANHLGFWLSLTQQMLIDCLN